MTRDTSIEAYREIKQSGLLGRLKWLVYDMLYKNGPMTANEMRVSFGGTANSGVYSTRLSELEKIGLVETNGKRICKTSGKKAYEWKAIKGKLPVKWDKPKKIRCKACNGTGHIIEQQARLF